MAGRGLHAQAVAAALIKLAEQRDVDALLIRTDDDRFERFGRARQSEGQSRHHRGEESRRNPLAHAEAAPALRQSLDPIGDRHPGFPPSSAFLFMNADARLSQHRANGPAIAR